MPTILKDVSKEKRQQAGKEYMKTGQRLQMTVSILHPNVVGESKVINTSLMGVIKYPSLHLLHCVRE